MHKCTLILVFIMRTLLCKGLLQYSVVSKGKNSFPHFALRTLLVFCYVKNNAYHVGQCTYLLSFVGKLWHFQCPSSCFRLLYVDVEAKCQMSCSPWGKQMASPWAVTKFWMLHCWDWQCEQIPWGCLGGWDVYCWNCQMHKPTRKKEKNPYCLTSIIPKTSSKC